MDPRDPDGDPNHSQNLITSSFYHFGHILKILSKSVHKFVRYLVHKQTDGQTDGQTNPGENITSLAEVIIKVSYSLPFSLCIVRNMNCTLFLLSVHLQSF